MPEGILQAKIGRFDGELKHIGFRQGEAIAVLLQKAGLELSSGEEINDEMGVTKSPQDLAEADKSYFITGNYKNGK